MSWLVSRKCYRRNWERRRAAIGRSAATGAESSRLASIGVVIVCVVRGAVANARGRGGGRGGSIIGLVYSQRLRVSGVSGVLSERKGRVMAVILVRRAVITLSVVARVIPRRLVCVASVVTATTVVVVASGGISTTIRGRRRACGSAANRVITTTVRAHALLPATISVAVITELSELRVEATTTIDKSLRTVLERVVGTMTV